MESDSIPPDLWQSVLNTGIVLLLLVLSALISGSEVAFFSLKEDPAFDPHDKKNGLIGKLLRKPQELLAAILVSNTFVNIGIVIVTDRLADQLLAGIPERIRFLVKIIGITAIILFFGEILPKVIATRNDYRFAKTTAPLINFLEKLFYPVIKPMAQISSRLKKHLRKENHALSSEDLTHVFEMTKKEATGEERKLLSGIISFGNTEAREIMKPRMDIFAVSIDEPYGKIIRAVREKGYSRIPVYDKDLDHIVGILLVKDLLSHLDKKDFDWTKLLRRAFFVPENIKLDDLLREFQKKRMHLAIVVDEYGGTSGLVTLEDVMEEVLGEEIRDEYDKENLPYKKLNANTYLFDGKTPLKDFYKYMKLTPEQIEAFEARKGPSESLAGFFLEINGHFPEINDKIRFENMDFIIKNIDKNRLEKIQIITK